MIKRSSLNSTISVTAAELRVVREKAAEIRRDLGV